MPIESQTRWEAFLSGLNPDRSPREILFDPLIEEWAFAGLSEGYREALRRKQQSDQERAVLVDRLRWIVQKRLVGQTQEIMLLYLAGCSQVKIAALLGLSRSTVRRRLLESGEKLKNIVLGTEVLEKGISHRERTVRILPLDTEDDFVRFLELVRENFVEHIALGTFADLREALVVYRPRVE